MPELTWGQENSRLFETGVDKVVFYKQPPLPRDGTGRWLGIPWSGVVSIEERFSGGEYRELFWDGIPRDGFFENSSFEASISAFSAPNEFLGAAGNVSLAPGLIVTEQPKTNFGLVYRTLVGNATSGTSFGYKLHLVYGVVATLKARSNKTLSKTNDLSPMEWDLYAAPPRSANYDTYKPTAHFVVSSLEANPTYFSMLETMLFGGVGSSETAHLPIQRNVMNILMTGVL